VETYKRRYWEERIRFETQLASVDRAVHPSTHRFERLIGSLELSLPIQPGAKSRPALPIPQREPDAPPNCLDLSEYYDAALTLSSFAAIVSAWLPKPFIRTS
jgi:hypothetical protein